MSFLNKSPRRVWDTHPASFPVRAAQVGLRKAVAGGPAPVRVLLVSDGEAYTSEQQFAPIVRHAQALRDRLGVVLQYRKLAAGLSMPASALRRFDVIGFKLSFRTPNEEAARIARHFRDAVAGGTTRIVYFDGDDDVNVQWPQVLEAVDVYVKKHMFTDPEAYTRRYVGKSNITDHVARHHGVSFAEDIIPASGGLDRTHLGKIHLGWNIGLDDKIADLARRFALAPTGERDIDVGTRAYANPSVWIAPIRNPAAERIEGMGTRFKVLAPRERTSQEGYYREMLGAKICVSPFGFGEICWRDFEAILCGCLLVKPDMGHMKTLPNIFVPGVTYVPVRWDYADLESVCAEYLADDAKRAQITSRARAVVLESLQASWFVDAFSDLLEQAGLTGTALARPSLARG